MQNASYSYFDHEADIGIVGKGSTVESAFVQAAMAVFAFMADLSKISSRQVLHIQFEETDLELALVEWLNALLGQAREQGIVLHKFSLQRRDQSWIGEAWGEPWQEEFNRGTEVKGATLTMLAVKHSEDGWEARCVVDV